jgi:hypothetical protein
MTTDERIGDPTADADLSLPLDPALGLPKDYLGTLPVGQDIDDDIEIESGGGGPRGIRFGHAYWKRPWDGFITIAQAGIDNAAERNYTAKGMTSLAPEYGKFYYVTPPLTNRFGQRLRQWNPSEPGRLYDRILDMGGAHHFPLQQVLENMWHRNCYFFRYEYPDDGSWKRIRVWLVRDGQVRTYQGRPAFPQFEGVDLSKWYHVCNLCGAVRPTLATIDAHRRLIHQDQMQLETLRQSQQVIREAVQAAGGSNDPNMALVMQEFLTMFKHQNAQMERLERLVTQVPGGMPTVITESFNEQSVPTVEMTDKSAETDADEESGPGKPTTDDKHPDASDRW